MNNDCRAVEVLDEYVEDTVAGRIPRAYQRMASALDIDVEVLIELISLFQIVNTVYETGRLHAASGMQLTLSDRRENDLRQN
ncbi:MAG: hypothetical protein J5I90_04460 [Caldilineales bacterium]|nr:hypothetical protein [Caldilineales bacterium]